ncbi:FecR family protein [Flavobacterium sufflavum]|uniref:FecR family protein n=1 Tax=Flavobacterium sufflavum TaxID=1921138 RepID=A0A437KR72_9FLAO|nr:FecR family protein [Flavobacterium sufflavum]RVT74431.1 FecR family protein [Flavobacterium sufflavum]
MSLNPQQYFSDLVTKLIDGSITKSELDKLLNFFSNNQEIENWPAHLGSKEDVQERIYEKIRLELDFDKNKETKVIPLYKKPFFKYAVAASVVLFITFTAIFNQQKPNVVVAAVPNKIEVGTDKAMLTLEDGSTVVLEKGKVYNNKNVNSTGKELLYNKSNSSSKKVVYNYLTIPRGGQFAITLSDGTKVWLNSETKLKFPVNFAEGKTRSVELVYGEAYFDVSPSTAHNGAGFTVFQQKQEIHVVGTEFNIKAYKDDSSISTTLVEGKVEMQFANVKQNLIPNQRANFDLKTNKVKIAKVDVYSEICWKDGVFSFEDKPLDEIMKVLSRWYDIQVVFENESIKKEQFNGVLIKDRNIDEILRSIKNSGIIKKYEFKNKILILK